MSSIEDYSKKAVIAGTVCAIVSAGLNPFDVTKIRMQNQSVIKYKGLISGVILIFKEEGLSGLCKGLTASMIRELTYSTIRIGAYEPIRYTIATSIGHDPKYTNPFIKFFSALLSGGFGAALASPLDLIKTRFQACMPGDVPPYKSTLSGLILIFQSNGFSGLYKGWHVTTTRAAILTSAQIGSYDSIKNNLLINTLHIKEGFILHLASAMSAGIITTTATNPVDVIKTRYMSDKVNKYKSPIHCVMLTYQEAGIKGFFKGWVPAYWRLGPHTLISLLLIEKARLFFGLNSI